MEAENQESTLVDSRINDKELNFRKQEAMYQRLLQEKEAKIAAYENQLKSRQVQPDEDDTDDEPYVDRKKLNKTLARFGEQTKAQTQTDIERAVQAALQNERKQNWMKQNNDFYDVMTHAEKLAQKDPELAESILDMPDTFERQKLVYKNIKALGLHKPTEAAPSIQDKIDANKKTPYYRPSGVGTAPYASQGDFSQSGQKQSYEKMQQLKSMLRI